MFSYSYPDRIGHEFDVGFSDGFLPHFLAVIEVLSCEAIAYVNCAVISLDIEALKVAEIAF